MSAASNSKLRMLQILDDRTRYSVAPYHRESMLIMVAVSHTRIGGRLSITSPLRSMKAITGLREPRKLLIEQPDQFGY